MQTGASCAATTQPSLAFFLSCLGRANGNGLVVFSNYPTIIWGRDDNPPHLGSTRYPLDGLCERRNGMQKANLLWLDYSSQTNTSTYFNKSFRFRNNALAYQCARAACIHNLLKQWGMSLPTTVAPHCSTVCFKSQFVLINTDLKTCKSLFIKWIGLLPSNTCISKY